MSTRIQPIFFRKEQLLKRGLKSFPLIMTSLRICLCRYTCRGLFEIHKLLFSFQMCVRIMETAGKLNMNEYNFFLRGGIVRKRIELAGLARSSEHFCLPACLLTGRSGCL